MQSRKKEERISRREKEIREIGSFLGMLKISERLTKKTKMQFL